MVWIAAKGWQVDNTASLCPNVVSFLLTLEARWFYVVGAYMPPNNGPGVHRMEQSLRSAPKGLDIILMG